MQSYVDPFVKNAGDFVSSCYSALFGRSAKVHINPAADLKSSLEQHLAQIIHTDAAIARELRKGQGSMESTKSDDDELSTDSGVCNFTLVNTLITNILSSIKDAQSDMTAIRAIQPDYNIKAHGFLKQKEQQYAQKQQEHSSAPDAQGRVDTPRPW